jgi:thiamine-phosphate pyrophosphorylase
MIRFDLSLYVITDSTIARGRPTEEIVAAAIRGGATMIQLREKTWAARDLVQVGHRLLAITRPTGVPLIVNDRVDVALAIDADGVHVGQDDIPVPVARRLLGPDKVVGTSAGTVEEAKQAELDGADYVGVGSIFATASKSDAGDAIGPDALRRIREAIHIPIVAIGGLTASNAPAAIGAGAQGVAVISSVVGAADVASAARMLAEVVRAAKG